MLLQIICLVLLAEAFNCAHIIADSPLGKVLKIYNYTGDFPVELMKGVEEIDIYGSTINCAVGKNISFTKVKKFVSKHTKFSDVPTDSWVDFPNVSEANLEDTETDGMHISEFNIYTAFETLKLKNVRLGPLTNNALDKLKKLRSLKLINAGITNIEKDAFNGLDNLEHLSLTNNNLVTLSKEILAPLKKLKTLSLKKNKFDKFGTENLPDLPELQEINLEGNPVNNIDTEQLKKKAPKLKKVKIGQILI